MKEIQLTRNKVTIVDDWRFDELSQYKWYAMKSSHSDNFYAARNITYITGKRTVIQMQRMILKTQQ